MEGRISHRGACAANSRRIPPPLLLFANLSHTLGFQYESVEEHAHQRLWVPRMARVATMVVAGWRYCGPLEHAGVNSVDRMERDGQPLTCTGASLQCRGW
jgi:hypothetical protein